MTRSTRNFRQEGMSASSVCQFSDFRALISDSFVPLHVTSDRPEPFLGRIRGCGVDDIHISEVTATEHLVERTPELIAREDRPHYKVSLMVSGTGILVQDNRQAVLQPGDMAIYDTQRPYSLMFEESFRTLVVMFPKSLIALPADMVGQLTAVRMSGAEGLGGMISPFLAKLGDNLEQFTGSAGTRLAHSTADLVTTLFSRELDMEANAQDPHRALLQQIRAHIEQNLRRSDLAPATIAAAHYISVRHLHALFAEVGTTVSSWVRERRLECCRRELIDPLQSHRPVAEIAAAWGFTDAAHFSRAFRTTYGESPSERRRRAQAKAA